MKIQPCLIGRRVLPISRGLRYLKAVFFGLIFVILWHQRNLNRSTKKNFRFFSLNFRSLRFFRLIFAYFTFVFASDFWCFASKWIVWNQTFFSLPSKTKFSLQFQISLPKRKWGRTLISASLLCNNVIKTASCISLGCGGGGVNENNVS